VIGFLFTVPAAFAADIQYSGFLGNPSAYDLLKPGPEGGIKLRWLKPGVDFKKYNRFMVDSVVFFLADKADYKGIDPQEMKELADEFNKKGATGGWAGSGETGMEAILLDSMTDEVIGMGVDQRQAEFEQRFSKWGSAADAFKFWSENAVKNIDAYHDVKREPKK